MLYVHLYELTTHTQKKAHRVPCAVILFPTAHWEAWHFFIKYILLFYVCGCCLHARLCTMCVPGASGGQKRVPPRPRVTDSCELLCCAGGFNLGPLQECLVFWATKPSLEPHKDSFVRSILWDRVWYYVAQVCSWICSNPPASASWALGLQTGVTMPHLAWKPLDENLVLLFFPPAPPKWTLGNFIQKSVFFCTQCRCERTLSHLKRAGVFWIWGNGMAFPTMNTINI